MRVTRFSRWKESPEGKAWVEGQRAALWTSRISRGAQRKTQIAWEQREMKANAFIQENMLQKACGPLMQDPPAIITEQMLKEMELKHPKPRERE